MIHLGNGMTSSDELHPSLLFRTAVNDRAAQAAIILLVETDVLPKISACITVDTDWSLAWVEWDQALVLAGHLSAEGRAIVVLASALATAGPSVAECNAQAFGLAIGHMRPDMR